MLKLVQDQVNKYPKRVQDEIIKCVEEINQNQKIKPISLTLSGSWAYGLARDDSDVDLRGLYQYNTTEYLGLFKRPDEVELSGEDAKVTELHKAINLAAKGNPQLVELLFSKPVAKSYIFEHVLKMQAYVLGYKGIKAAHIGYATAELKQSIRAENKNKHRKHTVRLLQQAKRLLLNQTQDLVLMDREEINKCFVLSDEEFSISVQSLISELDLLTPVISELPDMETLERLVIDCITQN